MGLHGLALEGRRGDKTDNGDGDQNDENQGDNQRASASRAKQASDSQPGSYRPVLSGFAGGKSVHQKGTVMVTAST